MKYKTTTVHGTTIENKPLIKLFQNGYLDTGRGILKLQYFKTSRDYITTKTGKRLKEVLSLVDNKGDFFPNLKDISKERNKIFGYIIGNEEEKDDTRFAFITKKDVKKTECDHAFLDKFYKGGNHIKTVCSTCQKDISLAKPKEVFCKDCVNNINPFIGCRIETDRKNPVSGAFIEKEFNRHKKNKNLNCDDFKKRIVEKQIIEKEIEKIKKVSFMSWLWVMFNGK